MDIYKLIKDESDRLEFKENIPIDSLNYLKTICAFSNNIGGKLIFGIEDRTKKIIGVTGDIPKLIDDLTNIICDSIEPTINPIIYKELVNDKTIIICEIEDGNGKPYSIKSLGITNGTFIRTAGSTRLADRENLIELILISKGAYFDELRYSNDSLSDDEINEMCRRLTKYVMDVNGLTGFTSYFKPMTPTKLLEWNMIIKKNDKFYPSNAFMMFRDDNPFEFTNIQCARFEGTNKIKFTDKIILTGALHNQVDDAMKFITRHLNNELSMSNEKVSNIPSLEIPYIAIREILVNAVVHRVLNYNGNTQVSIFDDRLEIYSPGGSYKGTTVEDMKSGISKARNRCLLNVFAYLGMTEHWGTGIPRSINLCALKGIATPQINILEKGVLVTFKRASFDENERIKLTYDSLIDILEHEVSPEELSIVG